MATFVPTIGHLQFVILSALLDGQPRSIDEIRQLQGIDRRNRKFSEAVGNMARAGLLSRFQAVRRRRKPRRDLPDNYRQSVYAITAAGRREWQATLDWYAMYGQRATEIREPNADADPIVSTTEAPFDKAQRPRLPTPAEDRKIVAHASPQFSRLYLAGRVTGAHFEQLAALDVPDVDRQTAVVPLPPHPGGCDVLPMTDDLHALFAAATDGRTSGPLFVAEHRQARWQIGLFRKRFARYRHAAGFPPHLQLLGQSSPAAVDDRIAAAACRQNGFLSHALAVVAISYDPQQPQNRKTFS